MNFQRTRGGVINQFVLNIQFFSALILTSNKTIEIQFGENSFPINQKSMEHLRRTRKTTHTHTYKIN